MDLFHETPSLKGVQQMLRVFATTQMRPAAPIHDREETMPWELMERAARFGMTQTAIIEGDIEGDIGGDSRTSEDGGDKRVSTRIRMAAVGSEELAFGCAGIALALGGSGLAAVPVAAMGTPEQKQMFVDCMSGKDDKDRVKVAAMALSEPSTGSDISSLSTTAERSGDQWVINGHKQWITNGQSASVFVVWAQTDANLGRAGVRGFIIPRATPGLVPGRKEIKLGIRASETAQVHFEECVVPDEFMLRPPEATAAAGLRDTKKMLDSTRPLVGAQAVGIARAAYEYLLDRVVSGTLRGTRMASHQHVAFELAEMEIEIQAARLLVHRAAWMADHGVENVKFASMAKAHAARTAQMVTTRAMALLGTEALEAGHPVEKWYRDAKIYDIFEGTGQIQRRIIARQLTGVNPT